MVMKDTTQEVDSSLYFLSADTSSEYPEDVYRVQLFAGQYYHRALEEKAIAEEVFDEPVRIDYNVPYYRVEVGNFTSHERAEKYLRLAKSRGYSKCWIISEPVDSTFWINLETDSAAVDSTNLGKEQ
jgi:hypothetical protein